MFDYCSILRLSFLGCAVMCSGVLQAAGLQPWLRDLSGIPLPESGKDANEWMKKLWSRTADYVASVPELEAADDCGDAMDAGSGIPGVAGSGSGGGKPG